MHAYSFDDFLLCMTPPLNLASTSSDPTSLLWIRKDKFLLSGILSSISESMLGHVNRCAHAFQVWMILEELFQSRSKARTMNLRFQLQTLKKGPMTVDDYILQMRSIVDGLLVVGHQRISSFSH